MLKVLGFAVVLLVVGCGGSDGSSAGVEQASCPATAGTCEAGKSQACACPGGMMSAQVCADDGSKWEACACAATGSDPKAQCTKSILDPSTLPADQMCPAGFDMYAKCTASSSLPCFVNADGYSCCFAG